LSIASDYIFSQVHFSTNFEIFYMPVGLFAPLGSFSNTPLLQVLIASHSIATALYN
jgi:hypothetical protein